jgi:hypothetical protein
MKITNVILIYSIKINVKIMEKEVKIIIIIGIKLKLNNSSVKFLKYSLFYIHILIFKG